MLKKEETTINFIEKEEKRALEVLENMDPGSDEYLNATRAIKTLSESKSEEHKTKIDKKVIIETALKVVVGFGLLFLSSTHILDDKVERISDRITSKK